MKTLTFVIFLISVSVIIGWFTGNAALLTWNLTDITTTPTSALNLAFVSLSMFFLLWDIEGKKDIKEILTTLFGTWTAGLTTLVVYSKLLGNYSVVERLFYTQVQTLKMEGIDTVLTPALGTIICFYILSIVPWIYLYNTKNASKRIRVISIFSMVVGIFAIIGHVLDYPILYCAKEGFSLGINLIMSVSFLICGFILNYISKQLKYKSYLNAH
jgi:hypothetical protein